MTKREMTIEEAIEIFKEVRAEVLAKETELSKQVFENLGIKAVDLVIKVLEQTRWIPVSERLPEDRELLLFSTKTDEVFEGKYFDGITNSKWYSFRDDTFAWNNVVTAWMPLPEPYKEESDRESEE